MARWTCGFVVALLAGGVLAAPSAGLAAAQPRKKEPPAKPGTLHVYDGGSAFTEGAIDRAKVALNKMVFEQDTQLTIDTYSAVPKERTLPEAAGERAKFFESWAKDAARGDRAKGVFVLVCRSPGYVEVLADKAARDRGFSAENEQRLRELFLTAFKDAAQAKKDGKSEDEQFKIRDKGLSNAVEYASGVLKGKVK